MKVNDVTLMHVSSILQKRVSPSHILCQREETETIVRLDKYLCGYVSVLISINDEGNRVTIFSKNTMIIVTHLGPINFLEIEIGAATVKIRSLFFYYIWKKIFCLGAFQNKLI